jgi:hypothetical protein
VCVWCVLCVLCVCVLCVCGVCVWCVCVCVWCVCGVWGVCGMCVSPNQCLLFKFLFKIQRRNFAKSHCWTRLHTRPIHCATIRTALHYPRDTENTISLKQRAPLFETTPSWKTEGRFFFGRFHSRDLQVL